MGDYQKGKIYQIKNTIDDDLYVGSTIQALNRRMVKHKSDAKQLQHKPLYQKMNEYGFDKFFIELIEDYSCNTLIELLAREGHWIRERGTLNKQIQGRSSKEWYYDNRAELVYGIFDYLNQVDIYQMVKWVDEFYSHGEYANRPFYESLEFAFRFQQAAGSTLLEKYEDLQFRKIKPKGD